MTGRPDGIAVLVTGAGAPPGVSILKALRQSALRPRIVATDADPVSVGLFRADAAHVLPRIAADEDAYLARLSEICTRERVSLVCFGSEIELRRVAPHAERIERETGARLVVNAPGLVETFMDKWTTFVALRERRLPVPDTVLATDGPSMRAFLERHGLPAILKPRHGSGSKNLFVVRTAAELDVLARFVPEPVLQEYLLPDDEEYTVGLYRSPRTGIVGQIVFRRSLASGLTYKAEVVKDEEIEAACAALADAFDVFGPVNVQLRKTSAGPRIFEVNLRFSSSAVMRAAFGFNEPELCVRDLVLGESVSRPQVRPGWSLRFWDEVYLSPEDVARMRAEGGRSGSTGTRLGDL